MRQLSSSRRRLGAAWSSSSETSLPRQGQGLDAGCLAARPRVLVARGGILNQAGGPGLRAWATCRGVAPSAAMRRHAQLAVTIPLELALQLPA
jgi:hypothetical protein